MYLCWNFFKLGIIRCIGSLDCTPFLFMYILYLSRENVFMPVQLWCSFEEKCKAVIWSHTYGKEPLKNGTLHVVNLSIDTGKNNQLYSKFALVVINIVAAPLSLIPILHCMCSSVYCPVCLVNITNRHRVHALLQNGVSVMSVNSWIPAGSAVAQARLQACAGFRQEIRQGEVL